MARLRVELVQAWPRQHAAVVLELETGAAVRDALEQAGLPPDSPVGIHGRRVGPGEVLADGDRVEVYRPLRADPKEARRRRAVSRRRR